MKQERLPFIWELNADGTISHAVGTFHLAPDIYRESARELLSDKKVLFLERDITSLTEEVDIGDIITKYKTGEVLQYLTDEEKAACAELMKIPLNNLYELPYAEAIVKMYLPYIEGDIMSVDMALAIEAKQKDISISGLETKEEQIHFFEKNSVATAPDRIRCMLAKEREQPGYIKQVHQNMLRTYRDGDLGTLIYLYDEWGYGPGAFEKRDKKMVERSLHYLHTEPCVVAVGILHLDRSDGKSMIPLYEKAGIKTRRI